MAGIIIQHPWLAFLGNAAYCQNSLTTCFVTYCIYSCNVIICIILAFLLLDLLNSFGMTIFNHFNDVFSALWIYRLFSLGGSTSWSKITKTEHWNSWHYEMWQRVQLWVKICVQWTLVHGSKMTHCGRSRYGHIPGRSSVKNDLSKKFIYIKAITSFCNSLQSCVAATAGHSEHSV